MTLPSEAAFVAPLVILICISYSMTSLAITRYKEMYGYSPWCHQSSIAALIGLLVGGAIKFSTASTVEFDNDVFFYIVLPPIIFSAGLSLKKKMFFRYISLITLFGVIGTIVNFCLITAVAYHATRIFDFRDTLFDRPVNLSWEHAMVLAAVLSGTDEVSALSLMPMKEFPRLGALIFGEGVLNDAISIVLFHVLLSNHATTDLSRAAPIRELAMKLIAEVTNEVILSFLIGVICGLINARLLKSLTYLREHPIHQTVLLLLFAYLAYTIAEGAGVSGILTLFITAVTQGHYSWHSLSKPAQVATKINAVALSDIAEGFAFSYVGLSMWEYVDDGFHIQFCLFIMLVVILSRLITVLVLCSICNCFFKEFHMPLSEQLGFTLGGIVRGCLCWAQILQISEHRMLVTTTLFIVMATSLAGGFIMPMIIPRLGLKAVHMTSREDGQKGVTGEGQGGEGGVGVVFKRTRSQSRGIPDSRAAPVTLTDRGRSRRKLSVYCFKRHAEAEDDLYAYEMHSHSTSTPHSPHCGSTDDVSNAKTGDGKIVNSWPSFQSTAEHDDVPHSADSVGINRNDSGNESGSGNDSGSRSTGDVEHVSSRSHRCSSTSQVFLDRMSAPFNFSSWESVEKSFHKKSSHRRSVPLGPSPCPIPSHPIRSRGISHSTVRNCSHSKAKTAAASRDADRREDRSYFCENESGGGSGRGSSRRGRERGGGREGERKSDDEGEDGRVQDSSRETEDISMKQKDIDDLDALNDEVSSGKLEVAMARNQTELDRTYGIDHTVSPPCAAKRSVSFEDSMGQPCVALSLSDTPYSTNGPGPGLGPSPREMKMPTVLSKWGDVNRYKRMSSPNGGSLTLSLPSHLSASVQPLGPLPEEPMGKERVKRIDTSKSTIKFPTREDTQRKTRLLSRTQTGDISISSEGGVESSPKMYKTETASAFLSWVHFDEEFLKPLFGGCKREYEYSSVSDELQSPLK